MTESQTTTTVPHVEKNYKSQTRWKKNEFENNLPRMDHAEKDIRKGGRRMNYEKWYWILRNFIGEVTYLEIVEELGEEE